MLLFSPCQQYVGRISIIQLSAYSVTKYGVEAFSDALRREMYPWGVQVSIVEPGAFKTNICEPSKLAKSLKEDWEDLNDQLKKEYGEEYLKGGKSAFSCNSCNPEGLSRNK